MSYFVEIKIVSDKLNEVRKLIGEYAALGFLHDGLIQSDDATYWAFVHKDFGLINK